MEASEQRQVQAEVERPTLRHLDPALIIEGLSCEQRASGFARLGLMVHAVLPRLANDTGSEAGR